MKNQSGQWIPVNGVEMKIGVERLGGILSAGDDETYTTDSTGTVTTEFKKDSLPGDQHGGIERPVNRKALFIWVRVGF